MRAINYICIDDQRAEIIDPLINRISTSLLKITRATPRDMELQISAIDAFLRSSGQQPSGILLDLRIDMEANEYGDRVGYRGPALAQELRTRMAGNELISTPIVLWSVNSKFQKSFSSDASAHDLFDAVYTKDDRIATEPDSVSSELVALAEGYLQIRSQCATGRHLEMLGAGTFDSAVYSRFSAEFELICSGRNVHEIARFLLETLIRREGLLVNEETLAARLGVDISTSAEAWPRLKSLIDSARYIGPFSAAWPRWWWFQVEDWWASISEGRSDLRRLSAEQRLERIRSTLGIDLLAPPPIKNSYSSKYFTVCRATKRPLDPIDGLRIMSIGDREWHDTNYVSEHAALERINKGEWKLDPLDRDRFDSIRNGARNEEKEE